MVRDDLAEKGVKVAKCPDLLSPHFGFVFILNSVIGLLTPPVGAVLFTVCGIAKAPLEKVAVEAFPFLLWQIAVLAAVTYVPFIATALPQYFGYGR